MKLRKILLLVCFTCAVVYVIKECRHYFIPKRFAVVEVGQIYRGGWQTPRVLRRILAKHRINTLLNVACKPDEPDAAGEGPVVRDLDVTWKKILMPGTGLGTLEQLDEAADIIANPHNRPIFVHCAAGVHRTNMAIAAYRLKHCGWSLDAALDEMAHYGYDRANDLDKANLLREFMQYAEQSPAGSATD